MITRLAKTLLAVVSLLAAVGPARGDTIQLANGDVLRGKVVSLSEKELVFHSDSFGTIKIERTKVDLIALGSKGLPSVHQATNPGPAASAGGGSLLGSVAPLLGTPTAQKNLGPMVDQLLGAGGVGDLQKNVDNARRGLQDLKKDLGSGPESQALDAYINLLNQFAPLSAAAGQQTQPSAPHPSPQKPKSPNADKKAPPVQTPSGTTNSPR
jgi:hypothetical protein